MSRDLWEAADTYIAEKLIAPDAGLDAALAANIAAGLPTIDVSKPQGAMLGLFARMIGARRILEIGTLGGYSTICLARALPPEGVIVTLEKEPRHAAVARANFETAGVARLIELRVGPALESLAAIAAEGGAPFDLVFIDADKPNNPNYLDWALKLTRPGSLIVVDNVVRGGSRPDAGTDDPFAPGARDLFDRIAAEPRLRATAIQTVGAKGWDGFAVALVA